MEIKKCTNCGAFITTDANLCDTCANKTNYDMTLLKDFFNESSGFDSISAVSAATGVSPAVIQQYIEKNNYTDSEINSTSFTSIQY